MEDERLERAFVEASQRWDDAHPDHNPSEFAHNRVARYFFWAGATVGTQAAQKIHDESYEDFKDRATL